MKHRVYVCKRPGWLIAVLCALLEGDAEEKTVLRYLLNRVLAPHS